MVYVHVQVVDDELSLREQAEAALEEASWSPEQWHHKHRGKIALKRGVKEIRRHRQTRELARDSVGNGKTPLIPTPVTATQSPRRPPALVSPSATGSSDAGTTLDPAHLEVRRCTRHVRDALRDLGRLGHTVSTESAAKLEHAVVRGAAALAVAPDGRTHKDIEVILALLRSTGFPIKSHSQMQKLCRIAKHVKVSPGDVLYRQGDVDYDIYIMLLGKMSVSIDSKEVSVLTPGKAFGELGLLSGMAERSATVICKEGSVPMQAGLTCQAHLMHFRADDLNATRVDLEWMFGHAKGDYHDHKLAGLKRLEMKLSAAMAHDPPPPEAYASHREFVASEGARASSAAFADFKDQAAQPSTTKVAATPGSKLRMNLLSQVQLFNTLSQHDMLQLSKAVVPVTFHQGDVIMNEGDTSCDRMYVVSDGEASVSKKGHGVVYVKKTGEAFGETALLTNDPRNATVKALTPKMQCLMLAREDFDKHVFGKINKTRHEDGAKVRRFKSLTKVESVLSSGGVAGDQAIWEAQHLEDRLLRWTTPLITRASARARLREFDGALLDVVETLRIQPRHRLALSMRPKLLAHTLQHREQAAADRELVARSLFVANRSPSCSATIYSEPQLAAGSGDSEQALERSERSRALYTKLKQEEAVKRLMEQERARKALEAAAEAANKPSGKKSGAAAAKTKKGQNKKRKKKKVGTAKLKSMERAEKTKRIVLTSLDASRSAAAQREMRSARRYALGQLSSPDLRWQATNRDGPPLLGPGGVRKRCVKVAPAAVAVESELGIQSSDVQPHLAEKFRSSCDTVARDRPYAQFWRSVKFSSAVFSPWAAVHEHNSSIVSHSSSRLKSGEQLREPSPSHWDYIMGRVCDILVDDVDARATRRRLLRMIEMLTHVFAYYTRLSSDAAEPRPGPRDLDCWSDGRRTEISPAVIHPTRLAHTEHLGCLWHDMEPPTASGKSIRTRWSQTSMNEMNSTLAERSATSPLSTPQLSPSGTLGWDSDDGDGTEDDFEASAIADPKIQDTGSSDESSDEENNSVIVEEDREEKDAPEDIMYEARPIKQLDMFMQHPWPPKGSKPMLLKQARRVIAKLYEEKVQADEVDDREGTMRQSFPSFIWEYFETKYGLKKIAQNKLGELINSVRKFASSDNLLKVFGSLSGMLDESSYSACACDFILDFIGSVYHNHEAIDELLSDVHSRGTNIVDIATIMDVVTRNYDLRSQAAPETLRNDLLDCAEDHDGEMCVGIDVCLDILHTTWLQTMEEGDAVLVATFNGFDKDHDGRLSLQEFNTIVREVERLRYGESRLKRARTEHEVMRMYQHAIDESDTGDGAVTLEGFLQVARHFGLGVPIVDPDTRQATSTQSSSGPLAGITKAAAISQAELKGQEHVEETELADELAAAAAEEAAEQAEAEALHLEGGGPELPYDRPDTVLTLDQLRQLALDCEAIGPALSTAELGRICHTVTRDPLPEDYAKHTSTLRAIAEASNQDPTDIHSPENELHIYEFIECVMRISCNTYGGIATDVRRKDTCGRGDDTDGQLSIGTANPDLSSTAPCADCLERFLLEHILPHSCTHDTTPPLRWVILEPKCRAVVATYMPGLEQIFCAILKSPIEASSTQFVDSLPSSLLSSAVDTVPTRSAADSSASDLLPKTVSRSDKSILQKKRDAIVIVEKDVQRLVSDTTVGLNQLLAFNKQLDAESPDGFFPPNLLLELWRDVTMQPGGVARVSAQNMHAEMTLNEWCEFVCLLALKASDGASPRGTRRRAAADTIQRFILRELFPLVSKALNIPADKLSETAAQRRKLDGKVHRVALSQMLESSKSIGCSAGGSTSAAIRVAGSPRRLSTERETTEEERLAATRKQMATNASV